jgi:hypothetical protein
VRDTTKANKVWNELVDAIQSCGGYVTGAPNAFAMQFQVPQGSILPKALVSIGHKVSGMITTTERWTSKGKISVEVYEIKPIEKVENAK